MPDLKLAAAQTNPVVGDFEGNLRAIAQVMRDSQALDLVVFGELALTGYPLADLSYRGDVIAKAEAALAELVRISGEDAISNTTFIVGTVTGAASSRDQYSFAAAHNTAVIFRSGRELGRYHKRRLPNYDVFDDWRNFVPGQENLVVEVAGKRVAVLICEDIWAENDFGFVDIDLYAVLNGSPFTQTKFDERRIAATDFAQGLPLLYVNLVGGQDELVFDGDSFMLESGQETFRAGAAEGLFEVSHMTLQTPDHGGRLWHTLVTGLSDYLSKTNQNGVVLGLSGGIDSALTAAIAAAAVGPERVVGVALPSRYSSAHSLADAKTLATNLGIEYREIAIEPAHAAFETMTDLHGLAAENVQARIRAVTLMAISNSEGCMLLSTGNKSEIAVGYSTIYGDAAGGFAPIKDLYKTEVWQLARWYNQTQGREVIPESSITKPPSAELRPGQTDQDSLPDYETLDAVLFQLIEKGATVPSLIAAGYSETLVVEIDRMIRVAEWKRAQGAIGTKVSSVAFGRGRRVPLATKFGDLR